MSEHFSTAGDEGVFERRAKKRGFFERRGREGFAEGAKKDKYKKEDKKRQTVIAEKFQKQNLNSFWFYFSPFLPLRPLRILRVLCVQKIPSSQKTPSLPKLVKTSIGAHP